MPPKKKPPRHKIVYLWTGVYDILSWLLVILPLWASWGTKLHWLEGPWFEWKKGSWPTRTWYKGWGGTCIGHGGWLSPGRSGGPGIDTKIEFHEHTHTEQFEAAMLLGFLMAISVTVRFYTAGYQPAMWDWVLIFCIWNLSGPMMVLCAMTVAWFRGEKPYLGSTLEEAAYALADQWVEKQHGDTTQHASRRNLK